MRLAVPFCRVIGVAVLVAAPPLWSAGIPVSVVGSTQTQIVINYTATTADPCTVTAVDNNGGPAVNDVDPTKFPGANQDLGRTWSNGFRWSTLTDGLNRTVTIGGHDEVKQGADAKWYSTALQVQSPHTITIVCNGGADFGSIQASTAPLRLGSTYPELFIPAANAPLGGLPQPTIDWSSHTQTYIDPISGVLLQPATYDTDNFSDVYNAQLPFASPVIDWNGAWTAANNLTGSQAQNAFASTSTPGAPLFAAFTSNYLPDGELGDVSIVPYGQSSSGSAVAEWCLSVDSGQTCANYTPQDVAYSSSLTCYPTASCSTAIVPANSPTSSFSGWGGMRVAAGGYDILNRSIPGVSASGNTVVLDSPSLPGFNLDRTPGSKFKLTSCASGPDATLTVAAVKSQAQIVTQESGLSLLHCTYADMASGIRVVLKNGGSLSTSVSATAWQVRSSGGGTNGERWICSPSKVTDIQTDCDGKTRTPPLSGFLCGLSSGGIYLLQEEENGARICQQSNLYGANGSQAYTHVQFGLNGETRWVDARSFLAYGFDRHLWKLQHIPNNYTAMPVDPQHRKADNFTYTDLTDINPIGPQIAAQGGPVADALATGLWPAMALDATFDNGSGGLVVQYRSQQQQDSECLLAWVDGSTNTLLSTLALYDRYPFPYGGCHFSGAGAGGYSVVGPGSGANFFNSSVLLGGPFVTRIEALRKNGSFVQWQLPITACSNAAPAVCTSPANNLDALTALDVRLGAYAVIADASGTWAGLNGPVYLHKIDNDSFAVYKDPTGSVPFDGSALGPFTSTASASVAPPIYNIRIGKVTDNGNTGLDASGFARITAVLEPGYVYYYPSGHLVVSDGDPIGIIIGGNQLDSTRQYYAKASCAGCSPQQFDVYTDSKLTQPAAASDLAGATYATFGEACPGVYSVNLPGPMYTDTGAWDSRKRPKIRCYTVRLSTEPESDFASSAEHAAYPPPPSSAEASNPQKSMLHRISVGDGIFDLSHDFNNHEIGYVLAVDRSAGENQIDVTIMRDYGDDPRYGWRGAGNGVTQDSWALQHAPGWTVWAISPVPQGIVDVTQNPPVTYVPPINGAHFDFVPGSGLKTVTRVGGYAYHQSPDDVVNATAAEFASTPNTFVHNSTPNWYGGVGYGAFFQQSYPSGRVLATLMNEDASNRPFDVATTANGLPAPSWKADVATMNVPSGNNPNNEDGTVWTRAVNLIRGSQYDPDSTTNLVYKIPVTTNISPKVTPVLVEDVPHYYFGDKSGPNSLITDADVGKFCLAYQPGECRPSSAPGDVFFAAEGFYDAGQCVANAATLGSPCAFGVWPGAGWSLQIMQTPVDTTGTGMRRLSLGFWTPPQQWSYQNWMPSPDGKWGFQVFNPVNARPRYQSATDADWFAFKIPPWVQHDGVDRTNFVPVTVHVDGGSRHQTRVAFGYGENGNPANFYCTSRQEACWTSSNPTVGNLFLFDSESQQKTDCANGCDVTICAIPGRVLYYAAEHSSGSTVTLDALQARVTDDPVPSVKSQTQQCPHP